MKKKRERGDTVAEAGRHLNTGSRAKRGRDKAVRHRASVPVIIARLIVVIAFAVVMLSPLRGCSLSEGELIGKKAAVTIAAENVGVPEDKLESIDTELIKLDDKPYYKVDFSAAGKEHSIVIDAADGSVVAYKDR